jgi:hypothetical protein
VIHRVNILTKTPSLFNFTVSNLHPEEWMDGNEIITGGYECAATGRNFSECEITKTLTHIPMRQ